ncbi:MAG: hypothetical protein Q8922_10300 [Bacteroidota bacterium]|nr:hypothetical protein [Bacteroidota bacterium]MDP4233913.1 hypothetical protein [Bacteroidota bacterium]MDP4242837.1 hypothetical protein [Bacteroidota bacterium]MDP4288315.1 hypothetical protein [Bacteroidota bacterium]
MQELLHIGELLRIIKNYGDSTTQNLFRKRGLQTRERRFVRSFLKLGAAHANDSEIARAVFGDSVNERDTDYVVLRSQIKKRLLSSMGHLQLRQGSPRRQAIYRTVRALFHVRVLLLLGARRTAMQILPRVLKECREFGLTQRAIECLEALAENASLTGNRAAYHRYDRELVALRQRADAESEAARLVQLNTLEFARRAFGFPGVERRARVSANRCKEIFEKFPSYDTGLAYYRMESSAFELERDHDAAIAITREADAFFAAYPLQNTPSVTGEFSLTRLISSFHASKLAEGLEAAETCEAIYPHGTNNWFYFKSYEFLLRMHSLEFDRARAVLDTVAANPRFHAQPDTVLERWLLYERYLQVAEGEVPWNPRRRGRDQTASELFRDFTRDIPIYRRDKAGYNIALLILHIYVLLATNRREEITMRTEAIPRYLQRHFRGRQTGATAGFLKSLILLDRCSFDLEAFREQGQSYLNQFLQPRAPSEIEDCQALPYPFLWKLFEDLLRQ